ncbi:hypothetical protein [Micromonospora sp. NPDC023956]|uniref:hypothetical protein n=1 Tax=Micromonospora sp. NPDC023956 TaxID=3155722 RepID=UPI0033C53183
MRRALKVCSQPGCPDLTDTGRCTDHRRQAEQARGTSSQRGYGSRWARRRADYLRRNPTCALDGERATVADHWPVSRRDLVAQGVTDPDADHRLRPLCAPCHGRQTAEHQPGGFNAR